MSRMHNIRTIMRLAPLTALAYLMPHVQYGNAQPPVNGFEMRFAEAEAALDARKGRLRHWLDFRTLEIAARALVIDAPSGAVDFLKQKAAAGNRLALFALAQMDEDLARTALLEVLQENKAGSPSTLLAISTTPPSPLRSILTDALDDLMSQGAYHAAVRVIALLAAAGDANTVHTLKMLKRELDSEEERAKTIIIEELQHSLASLEERLSLQSEAKREEWAKQEILFWQVLHDGPGTRHILGDYSAVPRRLQDHGIRFSVEFLLNKIHDARANRSSGHASDLMAVSILGEQQEEKAIPTLAALLQRTGPIADLARNALRRIGTAEALQALEE